MAVSVQIQWVRKADKIDPRDRITHIGGGNTENTRWTLTQAEAIAGIQTGSWVFYITKEGRSVAVVVEVSSSGNKYLKTIADGEEPTHLLSLPMRR